MPKAPTKAKKPEVKAKKPEVKAKKPDTKAKKPEVKAKKPDTKAKKPEVKAKKPGVKTNKPEIKVNKPENHDHLDKWIALLKTNVVEDRLMAVKKLAEYKTSEAAEPLIDLLRNCMHFQSRRETSLLILDALGGIDDPQSTKGILYALTKSQSYEVQRKAIDILGVSTFSHAISTLPSIILDQKKTTDIRKKAILALKKHQKAENIRALIKVACELLDERDDELRRLALAGLIEKKKKVNDLLDRDLKGKNHKRKLYAAKVLGDIGISSDVPKLKILMETEAGNEISKIAAESALLLYFT